jgi:thiamine-phosphate pyrophosphorylase
MMRVMASLYPILDVPHPHGLAPTTHLAAILEGAGARAIGRVQLRAKGTAREQRRILAIELGAACARHGIGLTINDDVDLALEGIAGVDGLHLGQGDPGFDAVPELRARAPRELCIGISTHDLDQLRRAVAASPDHVAYGPVTATRSKANPDPVVGFDGLADACRVSRLPVVAIGGLDPVGAGLAVDAGAAMIAVIGGLVAPTGDATSRAAEAYAVAIAEAARWLTVVEAHERIPVMSIETLEQIARWSDDLSVLAGLRLPARFAPPLVDGVVHYRPTDVCDLLAALGKQRSESWSDWHARGDTGDALVRLRRPTAAERPDGKS